MDRLTDEEIKATREAWMALPPGDWEANRYDEVVTEYSGHTRRLIAQCEVSTTKAVAKAIASSRTLVPRLLDEIEALKADLESALARLRTVAVDRDAAVNLVAERTARLNDTADEIIRTRLEIDRLRRQVDAMHAFAAQMGQGAQPHEPGTFIARAIEERLSAAERGLP